MKFERQWQWLIKVTRQRGRIAHPLICDCYLPFDRLAGAPDRTCGDHGLDMWSVDHTWGDPRDDGSKATKASHRGRGWPPRTADK